MDQNEVKTTEKRRVAKSVWFILLAIMLERYSTAGISSILLLFSNQKLGYDADVSTAIYHSYESLVSFFPIVGAVIADSWLGRYKTMVCMSVVLTIGAIIIAIGSIDAFYLPIKAFSFVGLMLILIADGCLFPLFTTYSANQYKSTEFKSIALFFALFYFMYNTGSITARIVSPILREDAKCFGNDDCFPLAFGIPGILMISVTLLFMMANRYAKNVQVYGTTILDVLSCIWHAIVTKIKSANDKNRSTKLHWLDNSEDKHGKVLVSETRVLLNVLVLYVPMTLFWALFYQQGSRWVFQATRMNGIVGSYTIKPDQFNVANPLLVLVLIPVFEYALYPLLWKIGIRTPLHKITLGGVLGGVAFLISAAIESQLDDKYLHMTWLFPQYLVMAMGEVLVAIQMMNFAYSEAPNSMKTILQAFLFVFVGFGNLIVVIVAGSKLIESQILEFILFAVLMFVDMIIFGFLARRYKSLKLNGDE